MKSMKFAYCKNSGYMVSNMKFYFSALFYTYKQYVLLLTSGIGALRPGILRFGYDGGGPYLCMAISHGGGNKCLFYKKYTSSY